MALTLTHSPGSPLPVEVEGITPDRLREKSLAEIERLEVFHGNRSVPLAELFRVSGDPTDGRIDFEGDLSGVHHIGYGMTGGEIRRPRRRRPPPRAGMTGGTIGSGRCRRLGRRRDERRLDPRPRIGR